MARVFKRGDSWCLDYIYQGKRHRPKIGAKRKAEAALAEIRAKIAAGDFVAPDRRQEQPAQERLIFAEFAKSSYELFSKAEHSANHYEQQRVFLRAHLLPFLGNQLLSDITRSMVEDYRLQRLRKVSKATVNREFCCLRRILRLAVDRGLLEKNPTDGLTAYRETPQQARLLEEAEVVSLLRACRDVPAPLDLHAFVACIAYAGLRQSEVLNMRWDWIDFERMELTVKPSKDWHTKNYKPRMIPLQPQLAEVLRRVPVRLMEVGGGKPMRQCPYVFSTPKGTVYRSPTRIQEALNRAATKAGIAEGKVGCHQLRGAFCSHAQLQGVPPLIVRNWMGHRDLKTTVRYSHTSASHEKAAMAAFGYETGHQVGTGTDRRI